MEDPKIEFRREDYDYQDIKMWKIYVLIGWCTIMAYLDIALFLHWL
jgi:hypothetical protein